MAGKLCLRVNGIDISKAWVRNRMENGAPFGKPEVVIEVPALENMPSLGEIILDNNIGIHEGLPRFDVEIREGNTKDWRRISPKELTEMLVADKSALGGK